MLESILTAKRETVARQKALLPEDRLIVTAKKDKFRLQSRLREKDWTLIGECKLASPSKGVFNSGKTVPELAAIYEANGAGALSVLTDAHFNGTLAHLEAVRRQTHLPLLRKDFTVDRYQIVESAAVGADVILLIAAVLDQQTLGEYLALAHSFGLDAIVEVHDEADLAKAAALKPTIIGINNRDLRTFRTDARQTQRLLPLCPAGSLVISESGLFEAGQLTALQALGVRGALTGESLVTAADIGEKVRRMALL